MPINHSWPLFEQGLHFELGHVLGQDIASATSPIPPVDPQVFAAHGVGLWKCDLSDNSLTWSAEVYDAFGFPRRARITRDESVALYRESSRAGMERLRAHAIKHRRGFTLDVEIQSVQGDLRWMRLVAAPICQGNQVTHLHGLKWVIR